MKPPEKMLKSELLAEVKKSRQRTGAYKKLFSLASESLDDIDELLSNSGAIKELRSYFEDELK